jgi:hypothetical protein
MLKCQLSTIFYGHLPVFPFFLGSCTALAAAIRQDLDAKSSELLLIILPGRSGAPLAATGGSWNINGISQDLILNRISIYIIYSIKYII